MEELSRRDLLAAGVGFATARALAAPEEESAPPNIVFVLADDMSAADLSCYGRPDYQTPHIDMLARQGVLLTEAYANSCTCSPTRVALLSGRYQNRLPVGNYDPLPTTVPLGFPPEHPTLASLLRARGYVTGLIGKWHLGLAPQYGPLKSGYDEFFGAMGSHIDYFSHDASNSGSPERIADLYEGDRKVDIAGYATDLFTTRAMDFVSRHRDRPFLLSLHYTAPHWPWQSREERGPPRFDDWNYDGGSREIYAAMVQAMDDGVGRLTRLLRDLRLESRTIVVFTSDNGGERFSYSWPLRGGKFDLWEGGIRVPALVRWPRRIREGSRSSQLAMSMDWLPTLLRAAGAQADERFPSDGLDLMPTLTGRSPPIERSVYWRTQWDRAARRGNWKYLRRGAHEYLFDIGRDPGERANLKLRVPLIFAGLKEDLARWEALMLPIPPDALAPPDLIGREEALEPRPKPEK